jgi:hypothetical protein
LGDDVNGNLTAVSETFATSKNRSFVADAAGHILQKTENGKTQNYFYANGKPLGSSGALGAADFDFNYTPVSAQYPASTPGSYVVSAGDTLRGIALAVFGDAQLWYLIADANGLKTDADLTAGRNLSIPNKVTNLRNAADTFKPYAPGAIIGDTTPTLPDPPPPPPIYSSSGGGGGGCGGFGAILTVIIVVVAIISMNPELIPQALSAGEGVAAATTYGMCAAPATLGEMIVNGMLVNAATQGASMALGLQDEFSWSGLAMGAISAGVGGALPGAEVFGDGVGGMMARAATGSLITQGIGVATGLQEHFSWSSVAASAIGAGLNVGLASSPVGETLKQSFGDVGSGLVGTLASGTAHALVFGGKANWANVAADVFGNVIANGLGYRATAVGNAEQGAVLEGAWAEAFRTSQINWGEGIQLADAGGTMSDVGLSPTEQAMLKLNGGDRLSVGSGYSDATAAETGAIRDNYDLSGTKGFDAYLRDIQARNAANEMLSSDDIATSKALLFHYYGYAMGTSRGTNEADLTGSLDGTASPAFTRALNGYVAVTDANNLARYGFYSNIQNEFDANGNATRGRYVDVTRDGRTVRVGWSSDFSNLAKDVGVDANEALRKTDFDVYQKVTNAAFATPNVTGFTINGAWRPNADDYVQIRGSLPTGFTKPWGPDHISSRAVDINRLDFVDANGEKWYHTINNEGTQARVAPEYEMPQIVSQFSDNLRAQGNWKQEFDPWVMRSSPRVDKVDNTNQPGNQWLHRNHIHIAYY